MTDEELEALAQSMEGRFVRRRRRMEDFRFDEQQEKYWDITTSTLLGAKAVNGAISPEDWPLREDGRNGELRPYPPALAINNVDTGLTVEGATWWPGQPMFIENVVCSDRGVLPIKGAVSFNLFKEPQPLPLVEGVDHQLWLDHLKKLFPDPVEQEHFLDYMAHLIQRYEEKPNHAIVLAGAQGIGKDTMLLPIRKGLGEWNCAEINPDAVMSQFNGYVKSLLLIVNEVRPQHEDHKASNFYQLLKPLTAAPPEMLPMTVKYANTIYIRNICRVVLTTNDPLTMYIPPDDRRMFVMTSPLPDPKTNDVFEPDYFTKMHAYLANGGNAAVVEWLKRRDISGFDPGAEPPMTDGKRAIIESTTQIRRTKIDEILENYYDRVGGGKWPIVIFQKDLLDYVKSSDMFDDAQEIVGLLNAKNFHFKMAERGYDMVRNPEQSEWRSGKYRTRMAFIRREVPRDQKIQTIKAALAERPLRF